MDDKMGEAGSTHGSDEKYMQYFGWDTCSEETTRYEDS